MHDLHDDESTRWRGARLNYGNGELKDFGEPAELSNRKASHREFPELEVKLDWRLLGGRRRSATRKQCRFAREMVSRLRSQPESGARIRSAGSLGFQATSPP